MVDPGVVLIDADRGKLRGDDRGIRPRHVRKNAAGQAIRYFS